MSFLCTCNLGLGPAVTLPPHDHYMGQAPDERGVWGPVYDADEVGRVAVDWKALARKLMTEDNGSCCRECGEAYEDDPDGSPGVLVHDRSLGDRAYDLDEDHAPIPENN